jgi:hypothetical protein
MSTARIHADTDTFTASLPERPFLVRHAYADDQRLVMSSLLALGRDLPAESVEYNLGDLLPSSLIFSGGAKASVIAAWTSGG